MSLPFIALLAIAAVGIGLLGGCVLPLPLEQEGGGGGPSNQPIIQSGVPDFAAGPFSPAAHDMPWSFSVTVTDADPPGSETLEARLYVLEGAALLQYGSIPITSSPSAPNTWTGETLPTSYCAILKADPGKSYYFYVYVSDAGFGVSDPRDLMPGHFDYRLWVVTCP